MANHIWEWIGPKFSRHFPYSLWKPRKTPTKKLTWPRIEPRPARWKAMMLPLDHSGRMLLCWTVIIFDCLVSWTLGLLIVCFIVSFIHCSSRFRGSCLAGLYLSKNKVAYKITTCWEILRWERTSISTGSVNLCMVVKAPGEDRTQK